MKHRMVRRPTIIVFIVALTFVCAPALAWFGPNSEVDMSNADLEMLEEASKKLYAVEGVGVGTVVSWSNPGSGNSGTIELTRVFTRNWEGATLPCRGLLHRINQVVPSRVHVFETTRCQLVTGEWKLF